MASKKVLLIGWDAADWKVVQPLIDSGEMPYLKWMVENGVSGNICTLQPVLSPTLWTTIATGKRPFEHGVLGFSEPTPDGQSVRPITNLNRKTKAVWNILNQEQKKSIVVGWWPSQPAEPINGVMVSNHYQMIPPNPNDKEWPMQAGVVHPPELREALAELRFHPAELLPEQLLEFIPNAQKIDQEKDRRLYSCAKIVSECTSIHSCATELLANEEWDFGAVYYDAIDHFSHGFMKYHPPRQDWIKEEDFEIFKDVVKTGYKYHDMMLGALLRLAGPDTTVMLISDHGFHPDHLRPRAIPREPAGPAAEHRDFGIFVMMGPNVKKDELVFGTSLLDIAPTVLNLFDLPAGEDMEGKAVLDAFENPPGIERIPSWDDVAGEDGQHPAGSQLDPFESKAALDQLVALGYIEEQGEDKAKAVANTVRELNYNLAQSYMDADRYGDAESLLEELYANDPLEYRFAIKLAMCYQSLERIEKLSPLIEELNTNRRAQAEAARKRISEYAEVARKRRDLRKEAPEDSEEAKKPIFNENEQRAIRDLRAMARVNLAALDYMAGYVAIAEGNPEKGLESLRKAQKADFRNPGIPLHIGQAYINMKRWKDAERSYRQAEEIDELNPMVHLGLARCSLNQNKYQAAIDSALKAVGLRYHIPMAHYCHGVARFRMQEHDKAEQALNIALSQNPNFAEAHEQLADIYECRKDEQKADEHRELAAELREMNKERKLERQQVSIPEHEAIDFEASLPKVPEVEPQQAEQQPIQGALRLAQAPAPPEFFKDKESKDEYITVVSGLPRSGTSMMMQMLKAAGLEPLTDGERTADEDNPKGYYEFEAAKQLHDNPHWVEQAQGKVIKVVAQLIPYLPQGFKYRVIFMERDIQEVIASQHKMLERQGKEGATIGDDRIQNVYERQLGVANRLLTGHQIPKISVSYAEAINDAEQVATQVAEFLGNGTDIAALATAIDPDLYRQRRDNLNEDANS